MNFEDKIFVGVTTTSNFMKKGHWKDKFKEIKKFGIKEISVFPTCLTFKQRKEFYKYLEESGVKKVNLVHVRGQDFTKKEFEYFYNSYGTRIFNCHEEHFDKFYKMLPEFRKNIVLEPNIDNIIENKLPPETMGGFCVDLSHFSIAMTKKAEEYYYILSHLKKAKVKANHLNGHGMERNTDLHFVGNKKQLNYLKMLPKELFSNVIALEMENKISTQLKYKDYIVKILNKKLK